MFTDGFKRKVMQHCGKHSPDPFVLLRKGVTIITFIKSQYIKKINKTNKSFYFQHLTFNKLFQPFGNNIVHQLTATASCVFPCL